MKHKPFVSTISMNMNTCFSSNVVNIFRLSEDISFKDRICLVRTANIESNTLPV